MNVFVVTHHIGGCNGENWFVVVAENAERAIELAEEKRHPVRWAEIEVEQIDISTEGVKSYGGYIE